MIEPPKQIRQGPAHAADAPSRSATGAVINGRQQLTRLGAEPGALGDQTQSTRPEPHPAELLLAIA